MDAQMELPRYTCHKEVWALKIAGIEYVQDEQDTVTATITPTDARYGAFSVSEAYINKHKPEVGGYYVVYADGYKSFSPAKAFEAGYTLVEGGC